MKALVLASFGKLEVRELPDPSPAPHEVVVKIAMTGICGSDIHGYTGENGRRRPGQVMGHETVGHVAALGSAIGRDDLALGDVVTFNPVVRPMRATDLPDPFSGKEQHDPDHYVIGVRADVPAAFAEYVTVPAINVVKLPAALPVEYGALVEPLAVAVHAVRRSGAGRGDSVLVLGGGPIGQSLVLALRQAGVEHIAVSEVAPRRRDLVELLGAVPLDPSSESVPEAVKRVFGGPATVAIDAVGVTETLATALAATSMGATVCLVGMGAQRVEIEAFRVTTGERAIVGSFTYSHEDFTTAARWVGEAPAELSVLISRVVLMDDADAAFAALASGDGTPGKVLVRLDSGGNAQAADEKGKAGE